MNKKIIILSVFILVVVCVSIIVICFRHNGSDNNSSNNNEKVVYSEIPIVNTKSIKEENNNLHIDSEIPQITNIEASFCDYINNKISIELDYHQIYNEMSILDSVKQDFYYETRFVSYKDEDFLSLVITQKISYGNNRQKEEKKCYVIDAKKGTSATIMDVASDPYNYQYYVISRINDIAFRDRIELKGGNGLTSITQTQPFYIKDGKLHIYFASGEIAPVANGELDFEMPFKFENSRFIFN